MIEKVHRQDTHESQEEMVVNGKRIEAGIVHGVDDYSES